MTISLLKNLKWGLRWGLTIAVGFTAIALIGQLGCYLDPRANCEPSPVSLVGFYFIGGTCGGLVLGLLRPIAKYKVGEMFLGTCIVAISFALLYYMYVVTDGWKPFDTILVAVVSLVIGPIATLIIRHAYSLGGKASSELHDGEQ